MTRLQKIGFALSLLLISAVASGYVIKETKQDEDITMTVNDGGVMTKVVTVDGATSRVGIGTSSPGAKLEANAGGTAHTNGEAIRAVDDADNQVIVGVSASHATFASTAVDIQVRRAPSASYEFLRGVGGNGTDYNQTAVFSITGLGVMKAGDGSAAAPSHSFQTSGAADNGMYLGGTDIVSWATGGTERMRLLANGDLLVGTTSDQAKLTVIASDATDNGIAYIGNSNSSASAGTVALRVKLSGGNDMTSAQYVRFQDQDTTTTGSISAANATTVAYNTSSDRRLKTDIEDLPDGLATVLALKPRRFKWKQSGQDDRGFIAQEVASVYPFVVTGDETGDERRAPMQMEYGKLTPVLVKAIQELKAENDDLRARLERLGDNGTDIKGTVTNDNAATGYVGEYVQDTTTTGTNFPGASTQWGDTDSISLTAGDWDIALLLEIRTSGATIAAEFEYGIGTVSGNDATGLTRGVNYFSNISPTASANSSVTIPAYRVSISGTTTYYGKLKATYSVATPQYVGRLSARRVR